MSLGRCGCGHVEYELTGDHFNTLFCYCKACQVGTGSDKYFGVWYGTDQLHIKQGELISFTRTGDSKKTVKEHSCSVCFTRIYNETEYGFVSMSGVTMDNHNELSPSMLVYTSSAPSWAVFPEGVPKYDTLPAEYIVDTNEDRA